MYLQQKMQAMQERLEGAFRQIKKMKWSVTRTHNPLPSNALFSNLRVPATLEARIGLWQDHTTLSHQMPFLFNVRILATPFFSFCSSRSHCSWGSRTWGQCSVRARSSRGTWSLARIPIGTSSRTSAAPSPPHSCARPGRPSSRTWTPEMWVVKAWCVDL